MNPNVKIKCLITGDGETIMKVILAYFYTI